MKFKAPPVKTKVVVKSVDSDDETDKSKKEMKGPMHNRKRFNESSGPQNWKKPRILQAEPQSEQPTIESNELQKGKKSQQPSSKEMEETRERLQQVTKNLPIFPLRKSLIKKAIEAKSLVIVGETGSGKTTQVPKFLYRANINKGKSIAITQPRRVAAISLAKRVSAELGCELGSKVGYHVRFSKVTSDDQESRVSDEDTKILFLTDGMLLRESLLDPLLRKYNVVLLDEAHERTVETDVLFGIVKSAQKIRDGDPKLNPLKIIVMSATMDVEKFSKYFDAEVFTVPGRTHKIDMFYEMDKIKDYVDGCLKRVLEINKTAPANEDILVFLTGKDEIEAAAKVLHRKSMFLPSSCPPLVILPFYSALPQDLQDRVFQKVPEGSRKVILSTNLAETSLTICGIKYVVDSGVTKVKTYDPNRGLDCLRVETISKAQANQRAGRAGREGPGICYRIYTEAVFKKYPDVPVPEIQRRSLSSIILQLMFMGIKDVTTFDFVDKPSEKAILEAVNTLKDMKAVVVEPNIELTPDGELMARFPLDPKYGRIILTASKYGCLHEILIIISMLSSEDAFIDLPEKRRISRERREEYVDVSGDLLTFLNVFREFNKHEAAHREEWCAKHFINMRALTFAKSVRDQLKEICVNAGLKYSTLSGNETTRELVLKCFCAGLYKNVAKFSRDRYYLMNSSKEAFIHPSSVLYKNHREYVLFCELVDTSEVYMRSVASIQFDWIKLYAPEGFLKMPFMIPSDDEVKRKKIEKKHFTRN